MTDNYFINFSLPWPPSVNHYWRKYRGRMVISKAGIKFKEHVYAIICDLGLRKTFNASHRLQLEIEAHPPDRRGRDIDNLLKATLDALGNDTLYPDDSQVDDIRIVRSSIIKGGLILVKVCEIK